MLTIFSEGKIMTEVALTSLWLPILLSTVACFMIGFLTWMVLPIHQSDWKKLPDESKFADAIRGLNIPMGNYMFPYGKDMEEMKSPEFAERQKQGPNGLLHIWESCGDGGGMGKLLGCQFGYLLAACFCLAYLATLGIAPGADFLRVFRFVGTAGILAFTVGHVPSTIWYKERLTGHVVDGIAMGLAVGLIFAAFWPAGVPAVG